ncbi:DUF1028 domain-containing protein [Providencia rettgeri]|uniref:DUF1028 domain-containing protein n=1 Tax=Providencia rettgeri TaxID=587 RepID=A0A939SJ43_PRORE|nr:DUF1028 domain-containing protein [Providencia rettgeri]
MTGKIGSDGNRWPCGWCIGLTWQKPNGGIATQAMTNPIAGLTGIEYLQQGHNANKSLNHLVKEDIDCERRQLIIMDNYGDTADWTGQYCLPWWKSIEPNLAIAGNMLASEQVLDAIHRSYHKNAHQDLADRLLIAMQAGADEGGDYRGIRPLH